MWFNGVNEIHGMDDGSWVCVPNFDLDIINVIRAKNGPDWTKLNPPRILQ